MSDDEPSWEPVARSLLARAFHEARTDVDETLHEAEARLRDGDELDASDIRALRRALVEAQALVEEQAAPIAGVEPWGQPLPQLPYGQLREAYGIDD